MLKYFQNLNLLDQCVEADIQQGDTLAKVALRYNVPISELKRVNNLLNEAEFHVLTTIKVPTKAASLLTELLPEVIVYIIFFGTFTLMGGGNHSSLSRMFPLNNYNSIFCDSF